VGVILISMLVTNLEVAMTQETGYECVRQDTHGIRRAARLTAALHRRLKESAQSEDWLEDESSDPSRMIPARTCRMTTTNTAAWMMSSSMLASGTTRLGLTNSWKTGKT
jgi:hypothetical protein